MLAAPHRSAHICWQGAARAEHMRAHLLCTHLQRESHSASAHHAQGPPPFAKKVNHSHTPSLTGTVSSHTSIAVRERGHPPVHLVRSYMYSYARTQCIVSSGSLLLVQHSVGRPIVFVPLQSTPPGVECSLLYRVKTCASPP